MTDRPVSPEAAPPREFCNEFADAEHRHVCRFPKGHDGPHHPHINRESSVHRAAPPRATTPEPMRDERLGELLYNAQRNCARLTLDETESVLAELTRLRATLASSPPGAVGGAPEQQQDEGWTKKNQQQEPPTTGSYDAPR